MVNLDANTSVTNVNFGYDFNAAVYGNVWENLDGDRSNESGEPPIGSGITVRLYVWTDSDSDNVVDAGEVAGAPNATDTTDANGNYFFNNLTGGSKYVVNVDTTTLPSGNTWTITDEDNPGVSDDPISGNNEYNYIGFTATTNANIGSLDFGVTRSGSKRIGDTLFYDWDADGTQDASDEGIPNVTVRLYTDADADGIVESGDWVVNTANTFAYKVIDGLLDINRDGAITAADDGTSGGCTVTDGVLSGCSTYNGIAIVSGAIDINGNGTGGEGVDDFEIGQYAFNSLSTRNYVVVVDTTDSDFHTLLTGSKDPDESGRCVICNNRSSVTSAEILADGDGNIDTEDFGYYPFGGGSIGDTVFKDVN